MEVHLKLLFLLATNLISHFFQWLPLKSLMDFNKPVEILTMKLSSGELFISESPDHPRLKQLVTQEHLDTIIQPYKTDMQRVLALAQWTSIRFPEGSPFPSYPPWDAEVILDQIRRQKTGGFCAQHAIVFGQACQGLGYAVRYFDLAAPKNFHGHFVTEVYIPDLGRWIVYDPSRGSYYTDRKNQPLDTWHLHQYYVAGNTQVYIMPGHRRLTEDEFMLYSNFRYYLRNNFLSAPVRVTYKNWPQGTQMIFEQDRLRWEDKFTKAMQESSPSLVSSREADFEFRIDLNKFIPTECVSVERFHEISANAKVGQLYKIRMTKKLLNKVIQTDLIKDPQYVPLGS